MKEKYSPMMMQYLKIKESYPDVLILFRLGDFYELFFDDAKIASKELQLALTGKNAGVEERVPMCGVPHHAIKSYIAKLINRGYRVGIVEQMEDPALAKGLVERDVVQIITPGAFMDVSSDDNNYTVAIDETDYCYVLSYADLSTGEINVMNIEKDTNSLISELDNILTHEVVVKSNFNKETLDLIRSKRNILISHEDNDTIELEFEGILQEVKDLYQMRTIMRLINYFRKTQKRGLDYLQVAKVIKSNKALQIDAYSRLNLELTRTIRSDEKFGSLFWLLDETKTAMGGRLLKRWISKPSSDINEITNRQDMIQSFIDSFMIRNDVRTMLDEVYDLERLIARISFGNANGRDMLQLKNSLKPLPNIKNLLYKLNNQSINTIIDKMGDFTDIVELLENAISEDAPITIKEGGIFKPNFNKELDEIVALSHGGKKWIADLEEQERERTGIKTLRIGYNRVFGYYIEVSKGAKDQIKDEWGYERKQTTINGERYITQELKEKEALILNADEKRMRLEYDLFLDIRKKIQDKTTLIQRLANNIALIDVLTSLAEVSSANNFVRPKFNFDRRINIVEGRHPVIEKVLKDKHYVPNDVVLNSDIDILLITGPNMGGKSTYMRELAVIVVMAQIGCFVPAKEADLMVFDQIFTRIGASDDLVSGQSTFMVEMNETNNALRHATENSLLIFDEIGRGTATFDGMALAQAIIEYITARIHAKTLFSTHYHELTKLDEELTSLKNVHVCVKENEDTITFLYKVSDGTMNKSYGINVARLAHLPDELLSRAKEILLTLESKGVTFSNNVLIKNDPVEEQWIKDLRNLDPLNMSPLEALNYLYDLKKKMTK
ncbi:MAG: DNA mismatch repair protein MutS [Erysipelotrichaceae bacterium]|nr:DNA mismatch repair protein MutS [Erysipelotrichaceae bacterium]